MTDHVCKKCQNTGKNLQTSFSCGCIHGERILMTQQEEELSFYQFNLTIAQYKRFALWDKTHKCSLRDKPHSTFGDRLSYVFTPTSIGLITTVECACGNKIDLSDDL